MPSHNQHKQSLGARVGFVLALAALGILAIPLLSLFIEEADYSVIEWFMPLGRSLWVASLATLIALTLGLPLAWWLARSTGRWRGVIRALVVLPMVLPPVVSGVALLGAFGRDGLLGVNWAFQSFSLVIAAAFVAFPFFVIAAESAFRASNRRLEDVARTLGASPAKCFLFVVVPQTLPVLVAGAVLTFSRAIGEFGATLTFAGNYSGRRTMPLEIYHEIAARGDFGASVALAQILLLLALGLVLALAGLGPKNQREAP